MEALALYRDDGFLAEFLAKVGRRLKLPSTVFTLAGVAALGVALSLDRGSLGGGAITGVVFFIALATAAPVPQRRIGWLTPPLLRLGEYGFYVALAGLSPSAAPAIYALVAAMAFHHYDVVYRLRHQKLNPPQWVQRLGLGWEGRMLVMVAAAATGHLTTAAWVLACWSALLFVSESIASWSRVARDSTRAVSVPTDEDEDE